MARFVDPVLAAAIRDSGEIICEVDVLSRSGEILLSTVERTDRPADLAIIEGSITTDETRAIPGNGTATVLVDEATRGRVMPAGPDSPLSPIRDAMLYVRYTAPGTATPTPYGAYDLADVEIVDEGEGVTLSLEFYDLARRVERAKFFRPRAIPAGTTYEAAFRNLLESVLPDSHIVVSPTEETFGLLSWDVADDRLKALHDMTLFVGFRIDFNDGGVGDVRIEPDTDAGDDPVWTFTEGDGTVVRPAAIYGARRRLSDEKAYNGVITRGNASGSDRPPVRAEVWDTDPSSPTYFDPAKPDESPYGPVPYFLDSIFVHTKRQAAMAGRAMLPKVMGVVERLRITTHPHPGIAIADPVQVDQESVLASGTFIVESVSRMPLNVAQGPMEIVCRERRLLDATPS